jgi:hypothetical protein
MGVSEIFDIFRRPGHGLILSLSKDEEGRRPVSKDDGVSCVAGQRACP